MTLQHALSVELLGWAATAVFVASYFARRPEALVRVQIAGALMWVAYGGLVHAPPVIAANLLVVAAAAWKARRPGAPREGARPPEDGAAAAPTGRRAGPSRCA